MRRLIKEHIEYHQEVKKLEALFRYIFKTPMTLSYVSDVGDDPDVDKVKGNAMVIKLERLPNNEILLCIYCEPSSKPKKRTNNLYYYYCNDQASYNLERVVKIFGLNYINNFAVMDYYPADNVLFHWKEPKTFIIDRNNRKIGRLSFLKAHLS